MSRPSTFRANLCLIGLGVSLVSTPSALGQRRAGGAARGAGGFHHGGAAMRGGAAFRAASFGGGRGHVGFGSHHRFATGGFHHGIGHRVGHIGRSIQHRHVRSIVHGHGFGLGVHYPYTYFHYPYCRPYYGDFYWKYPRYSIGYSYYPSVVPHSG